MSQTLGHGSCPWCLKKIGFLTDLATVTHSKWDSSNCSIQNQASEWENSSNFHQLHMLSLSQNFQKLSHFQISLNCPSEVGRSYSWKHVTTAKKLSSGLVKLNNATSTYICLHGYATTQSCVHSDTGWATPNTDTQKYQSYEIINL